MPQLCSLVNGVLALFISLLLNCLASGSSLVKKSIIFREVTGLAIGVFFIFSFQQSFAQVSAVSESARVIKVGPVREVKTISAASNLANNGDVVEVDAGDYSGDVAIWRQDRLTLRAVGGRVRLVASGASVEGKGIWVIRGGQISVSGFDFVGAAVRDKNGAGIRLEKGQLSVDNCRFLDNENGILTANNAEITLKVRNSEFGHNGAGDGQSHNIYVGGIGHLQVTGSYFHHARSGHLLKTRAVENFILYNRLVDGEKGRASYELEFPNGGIAYVIGNVIEQSPTTENFHLVSFGAEGLRWPKNELYLVNNTLIDLRAEPGVFLRVKEGVSVVYAVNNLLVGKGSLDSVALGEYGNNFNVDAVNFVNLAAHDYRLKVSSRLVGKAITPKPSNNVNLQPESEYVHPLATQPVILPPFSPGALQSLGPRS